jgi:hypothetical protein
VLSALPKVVASEFTGCSPTNFHQARLCLSSLPPEAGALQRQNAEQVAHQNFFEHRQTHGKKHLKRIDEKL